MCSKPVWLDGRFNTKRKPQENFGRELMELFSMGVGFYTESDVYAAARVFTGWNLRRTAASREDTSPVYEFVYYPAAHETAAKTFSFPIYPDGTPTIPSRSASDGMQNGGLGAVVLSRPPLAVPVRRRVLRRPAIAPARERRIASHVPIDRPHLALVNSNIDAAMNTLDRVALVAKHQPSLTYPTTGLGQTLRTVAGAISTNVGTKVFWVQLGGFDTHASQAGNNGAHPRLMTELNDAVLAFYNDLRSQGLLGQVLLTSFSEFGRRVYENGSVGCDHGAAGLMFVLGGAVRGGLYGTAASLNPDPQNPTLENSGGDVHYETDFRSVYARLIDSWLGADSVSLLGGDFRRPGLAII